MDVVSLDQIFSTALLKLVVPDTTLEFPPTSSADKWLEQARSISIERKQAFFDEHLQSLLLIYLKNPEDEAPEDPNSPPDVLLDLLVHIQVSMEASYISQNAPTVNPETPRSSRLLGTPKTGSLAKTNLNQRLNPHPSILPPSTPHPMPATGDQDRKYSTAEGTILIANIWGSNTANGSPEMFSLLWSDAQNQWVAIYKMDLTVSFLRLTFSNPLLCLTVSATLREKPISRHPTHPLTRYLDSLGDRKPPILDSPRDLNSNGQHSGEERSLLDGLEEVNLLSGLLAGTTFSKAGPSEINLPSLRLGTVSRQKLFSLPPILINSPIQPSPSPMTAVRKAHPTLRKSFRKTLNTVSGFRVRMRTVFVPYVLLPETEGTSDNLSEEEKERSRVEAGSEERTVVLCVEIENSGDLGMTAGFMVEKVDVSIGGEGAKATLIGWGDGGFGALAIQTTFPLFIGPLAQYNLLYAVTFMRSPEDVDAFAFANGVNDTRPAPDLQRAVTINIFGKPYLPPPSVSVSKALLDPKPDALAYPTQTFSSRWNCVLDLSAQQSAPTEVLEPGHPAADYPNVLPEPASPFPSGFAIYSSTPTPGPQPGSTTPQYSATAGSKRFAMTPGANFAGRTVKTLTPNKYTKANNYGREASPIPSSRLSSYTTPGESSAQYLRAATTYSAPPPPPIPSSAVYPLSGLPQPPESPDASYFATHSGMDTPTTPAYPAYPMKSALPPTPLSQRPISTPGNVGLSVEIRRERAPGADYALGPPQTPLPFVSGAFGEQTMLAKLAQAGASGESVIVSVGLLPPLRTNDPAPGAVMLGPGKIYPLDVFTLDIFVFNQSMWPRRFEVTCPERRHRRRGGVEVGVYDGGGEAARKMGYPGVLPLESRIRVGPLRPSACQSVRMDFLAVTPGVHSIDTLTLTDVETGFSTNLRSVLDVVVHDTNH